VPFSLNISAPVTIEACAVVRIAAGATITINPNGAFIAAGRPGNRVTIDRLVPGSAWSSICALGGILSLTQPIARGGGAPAGTQLAYAGALQMQIPPTGSGTLHVDGVEIADSQSQGIYINGPV
jgi:hypothetical protein